MTSAATCPCVKLTGLVYCTVMSTPDVMECESDSWTPHKVRNKLAHTTDDPTFETERAACGGTYTVTLYRQPEGI